MIRFVVIAIALAGCAAAPSGNSPLPQQSFTPAYSPPAYRQPYQAPQLWAGLDASAYMNQHRSHATTCSPGFSGSMNCVSW